MPLKPKVNPKPPFGKKGEGFKKAEKKSGSNDSKSMGFIKSK